jgi:hypothetical protein
MSISASPSSVVPFHYLRDGVPLIVVATYVDGVGPLDFVVDTGNGLDAVAISPAVATRTGIISEKRRVESKFPVGFSREVRMGRMSSFRIGEERLGPMEVAVLPALAELGERVQARVDGNIGYCFLQDYVVTIDAGRRELILARDPAKGHGVPFRLGSDKPLILADARVNGEELTFAFDTGASLCCIDREVAERLCLRPGATFSVNGSASDSGHIHLADTFEVAGRLHKGVSIAAVDFLGDLSRTVGERVDGIVGHNFWSRYRLTIDYPARRLILANGQ